MCVYFVFFRTVLLFVGPDGRHRQADLMGLKPNPEDPVFLQCFHTVDQ